MYASLFNLYIILYIFLFLLRKNPAGRMINRRKGFEKREILWMKRNMGEQKAFHDNSTSSRIDKAGNKRKENI